MRDNSYGSLDRARDVNVHKAEQAVRAKVELWRKLEQESKKFKVGDTVNHALDNSLKNGSVVAVDNRKITVVFGMKRLDCSPSVLKVVDAEEKPKADWRKKKE